MLLKSCEMKETKTVFRIALANLRFPATSGESVDLAEQATAQASREGAGIVCFPECFVPGYRAAGKKVPPPDAVFLKRAWSSIAAAARGQMPPTAALWRFKKNLPYIPAPLVYQNVLFMQRRSGKCCA
jgi:hypothetical protein